MPAANNTTQQLTTMSQDTVSQITLRGGGGRLRRLFVCASLCLLLYPCDGQGLL